jgi:hypothetical protein
MVYSKAWANVNIAILGSDLTATCVTSSYSCLMSYIGLYRSGTCSDHHYERRLQYVCEMNAWMRKDRHNAGQGQHSDSPVMRNREKLGE